MGTKSFFYDVKFLLAALPFISYAVTYHYERGFIGYYGLPEFLISVSIESVIYVAMILIGVLFIILPIIDMIREVMGSYSNETNQKLEVLGDTIFYFLTFAFFVWICWLFFTTNFGWYFLPYIIIAALLTIVPYLVHIPELFKRGAGGYKETEKFSEESFDQAREKTFYKQIENQFGILGSSYGAIFFLVVIFFIPLLGMHNASNRNYYIVGIINGSQYALVKTYGSRSIFVNLEREWQSLYEYNYKFSKQYRLFESLPSDVHYQRSDIKKVVNVNKR